MLGQVVSTTQSVFVEGRQILDPMLIGNEAISTLLRRKGKWIMYNRDIEKAYIEKAYDHLN